MAGRSGKCKRLSDRGKDMAEYARREIVSFNLVAAAVGAVEDWHSVFLDLFADMCHLNLGIAFINFYKQKGAETPRLFALCFMRLLCFEYKRENGNFA